MEDEDDGGEAEAGVEGGSPWTEFGCDEDWVHGYDCAASSCCGSLKG